MILHEIDYQKWPNATYDVTTTNASFIKYCQKLRSMGVKNYRWPLTLLNPELRGLDPYSPNLTASQMLAIRDECVLNPMYLLREVARVKGRRYIANRGNMALMWLYLNHIDLFLIQPRQTGKSVGVDWLMIWLIYFRCYDTTVQMITKDASLRTDNIQRIKGFLSDMPAWLFVHSKDDPDNTLELGYAYNKTHYKAKVPRNSQTDADKVGRGATSATLQFDETPYIAWIETIMTAALGSSTAERARAIENGDPYGILYTTTAGKIDSRDGGYVYRVLQTAMQWSEHLFDAGDEKRLRELIVNTTGNVAPLVNITLSHRQLGYTDEWLWEQMALNKAFGEAADRDYFNRWTNGTGTNPISVKTLAKINASLKEPEYVEICPGNFIINWYIPKAEISSFMANNPVVCGCDTSDAIGRDGISLVMLDPRTMKPVATGTYNKTSIPKWASFFGNLMCRYRNITWIPERKSSAQSIIDAVCEILHANGENPFERIFNSIVQEKDRYEREYMMTRNSRQREIMFDTHKQHFGFNTTGKTRDLLYVQVLNTILEDAADGVMDATLISEMSGLVTKNGRIDHVNGGHDDSVIAYLLAGFLLIYGKNLSEYGIDGRVIRSKVSNLIEDTRSVADRMRDAASEKARARIEELIEIIGSTESEFMLLKAEQEIRVLMSSNHGITVSGETIQELFEKTRKNRGIGHLQARLQSSQPSVHGRSGVYI